MENTSHKVARMAAALLSAHGVSEVVASPGTRNAPLIVAMKRHGKLNVHTVVDERSAAFIGLGMSSASSGTPVAIVCTSGTAPLNYAPALAEAWYRHIPLIAITADRPKAWIDQNDSQTINQAGIYANFIKKEVDIDVAGDDPERLWMANRAINEALLAARTGCPGPVHINIRIDAPIGIVEDVPEIDAWGDDTRVVTSPSPVMPAICTDGFEELAAELAPPARVMVVAGFMLSGFGDAILRELSRRPNVVVLHEAQSNLHGYGDFIPNIDASLLAAKAESNDALTPDIVITLGGAILSQRLKNYLRTLKGVRHWSIGEQTVADCFRTMTRLIPYDAHATLSALVRMIPKRNNSESTAFKQGWLSASKQGFVVASKYAADAPWSDFKAVDKLMDSFPRGWNLEVSNGSSIRYVQLFDYSAASRIQCNRGVSGIDGSTSTAIGAATISESPTILLTGDMSMQYDMGALATDFIPATFKIVVLSNRGGNIFRFISSTRHLDECESCLAECTNLPLEQLARAFKFKYLRACNEEELDKALPKLISSNKQPVILEIFTDGNLSAQVLHKFYKQNA